VYLTLILLDWFLIEFCLAPLFDCYGLILMIGRIQTELFLHLIVVHLKAVSAVTDGGGFRIDSDDAGDERLWLTPRCLLLSSFYLSLNHFNSVACYLDDG
jgi:hypothetical protein